MNGSVVQKRNHLQITYASSTYVLCMYFVLFCSH